MNKKELDSWFSSEKRNKLVAKLQGKVGLTRIRAEYFVRLWIYLLVKSRQRKQLPCTPPLTQLELPSESIDCTHREAADLFYCDQDRGSERAAGMILDKLAALRLINKYFDGNTCNIEILPIPELAILSSSSEDIELYLDDFDARSDAIPVANLLATNYNWMNNNQTAIPAFLTN